MPKTINGSSVYYSYLTKGEERAFWHKQRKSLGVAITARDRQAAQEGKQVTVQQRPTPAARRRPSF